MDNGNPIKCNVWEQGNLALCVFEAHISRSGAVARFYRELDVVALVLQAVMSLASCAGGSWRRANRNPIKYIGW